MTPRAETGSLDEIIVYPIKSCAGISLAEAQLEAPGLVFDRRWMIVDEHDHFLTQRQLPRMALITPEITGDALVVTAAGMDPLPLPMETDSEALRPVRVWDDVCQARCMGKAAATWFSTFLGVACSLVYLPQTVRRSVDPAYAKPTDQVGFADGFPLLLASEASLAELNSRLEQSLPMDRFRPNLVIKGFGPFTEDGYKEMCIGNLTFRIVKPCARCSITTVDQTTAGVGKEPLATLAQYRKVAGHVMFGQNLIHDNIGTLRVGDQAFFRGAFKP